MFKMKPWDASHGPKHYITLFQATATLSSKINDTASVLIIRTEPY